MIMQPPAVLHGHDREFRSGRSLALGSGFIYAERSMSR